MANQAQTKAQAEAKAKLEAIEKEEAGDEAEPVNAKPAAPETPEESTLYDEQTLLGQGDMPPVTFVLTGPNEGKTMDCGGLHFEKGEATVKGDVAANHGRIVCRFYGAMVKGSKQHQEYLAKKGQG